MSKENKEGLITASGFFNGSSTKGNFDVQLKFKFPESELANSIQFLAAIGKRMKMIAIVDEDKINFSMRRDLGMFLFSLEGGEEL